MTQSKEDKELMDRAFQDEAIWRDTVEKMRRRNPTSCGDLLRYGAIVTGWSDDQ